MTAVAVVEWISLLTPLAVRLRDEATRAYVSDGISVIAWPKDRPELRTTAFVNRAGIFIFRNLPGMREVGQGAGDDEFWTSHPPQSPFTVDVRDPFGRFLPFRTTALLPHRGTVELPLFSAPSRRAPDAMGILRAELRDADTHAPAAWALIEATAGEQRLVTGLADRQGRVMLPLFYPKPVINLGSPGTLNTPLTQQSWGVDITIRYRRREPAPETPELADVLTQPAATAWKELPPADAWTTATLQFGKELRLATVGSVPAATLYITPG